MEESPLQIKIMKETNRILKAQQYHFLSLSFLFLFPASVAIAVYPMLQSFFSDSVTTILFGHATDDHQLTRTLLLALTFLLFTTIFSLFAVGSITYSVIQAFHGQPINLKSAIKSISTSFFPLLATNLLVQIIFLFITFVFVLIFASFVAIAKLLRFHIEFTSPCFLMLCFAMVIGLLSVLIYLQVNWALSSVIVVAETTWGLASLKRSMSLVKGRQGLVFRVSLVLGFYTTFLAFVLGKASLSLRLDGAHDYEWASLSALLFLICRTGMLRLEMAATTVLYMYCNEAAVAEHSHQVKEFAGECVSLAVDDDHDEAPFLVSVVSKLDSHKEF